MICISGGSSFVGKAIIRVLDEQHIAYWVIPRVSIDDELEEYLSMRECTTFIHCAWAMNYESALNDQENDILNMLVLNGIKKVQNFLFISSIHVLTNNSAYSRAKTKWETLFFNSAVEVNNTMATIFLPHLIAPEVGQNNHSVIYKFYNNWKVGLPMDIHDDQDVHYTDFKNFKSTIIDVLSANRMMKVIPQFFVASVSKLKSEFLANNSSCPIIEALKTSNI